MMARLLRLIEKSLRMVLPRWVVLPLGVRVLSRTRACVLLHC